MSKYELLAFYLILGPDIHEMFEWRRQYTKILKLIIFGRKDYLFEVPLLNELAYHYTYGDGKLKEEYNTELCKEYSGLTGY